MEKISRENKQESEREQESTDWDGEELTMIDPQTFYDLLMEQQEQM